MIPPTWKEATQSAVDECHRFIREVAGRLASRSVVDGHIDLDEFDRYQVLAYELALAASELRLVESVLAAHDEGAMGDATSLIAVDVYLRAIRARFDLRGRAWGLTSDVPEGPGFGVVSAVAEPVDIARSSLDEVDVYDGKNAMSDEMRLLATVFARFADERVAPFAEEIHRTDGDVPESIIDGLRELGGFGMSIPEAYGGSLRGQHGRLAMVIATEELSRVSLGAAGSLLTRPEILAQAILQGGTEEQRDSLLPRIASGESLVAVATTEADAGSDLASIKCRAVRVDGGWRIDGTKTWCTFAGRADLIMLLARTDPEADPPHRGLSLFVVEKEPRMGHSFDLTQEEGGRMWGRSIPTIGYRGMHSFEVGFQGWHVQPRALIGGNGGLGRGFYMQMDGFAAGRLQTAARATGVMDASFTAARSYARQRVAFGRTLIEYPLIARRLAEIAARVISNRTFTHQVAKDFGDPNSGVRAAMVKAVSCQAAALVTSSALQIHGGYGYAQEYPVSRFFVDARVLPIFEGTEEVLALRVIARQLVEQAASA